MQLRLKIIIKQLQWIQIDSARILRFGNEKDYQEVRGIHGRENIFKFGMRCDLCLVYRPNVENNDRRAEICKLFSKVWQGFETNPNEIICDGCASEGEEIVLFSPSCETRKCVMEKGHEHCGYCSDYPCDIFPAEPTYEELVQKIEVEKQWTWGNLM